MFDEIKIERNSTPKREQRFPWALFISFAVGLITVGVVGFLGYIQIQRDNEQIKQVDERPLKNFYIDPRDFNTEQLGKLTPFLRDYTADYCDPRSKIALLRQLDAAGFVRLAAQLANDHYEKCAKDAEFLILAYTYYEQLGEYPRALEIINRLVEWDPANADFRFSRGRIYEATKHFEKALMDYISTVDLLGRPEEVAATQFYYIATMYAELGRFCEAATPLETYISYDLVKRRTPQLDRLISEYRSKGNCKQSTSGNNATVRVRKSGAVLLVEATLNNVTGLFVLDTGASFVSVTKSFANKAKLSADIKDEVTLQTANGLADGLLATANSIQVGNAYSTFVPVVVVDDAKLGSEDGVSGLLGMSFLSRFVVKFGTDSVELRGRF